MKKLLILLSLAGFMLGQVAPAGARDTKYLLPISAALEIQDPKTKLDGSVKFFFGKQETPKIIAKLGSDVTNLKTNAVGKSDETACNWVFYSAMLQLERRAKQLGANAVVNIVSYYQKNVMSSATEFECHAGAVIAGVALKGEFVKIPE
jgi:uncharacterized protein YbjQ (UPF0145 family)